jgi:hypothetical protein
MKPLPKQFLGGLAFLVLGNFARNLHAAAIPSKGFRGHPLAADEGGLVVELAGWIGVFGLFLVIFGAGFMVHATGRGFQSGSIQAFVRERLPKRKPAEGEEEKTPVEED